VFNSILVPDYLARPVLWPQLVRLLERHAFLPVFVHAHEPLSIGYNVNMPVVVVAYWLVNRMLVGLAQVEGCLL
jgi:hypothetical protein